MGTQSNAAEKPNTEVFNPIFKIALSLEEREENEELTAGDGG